MPSALVERIGYRYYGHMPMPMPSGWISAPTKPYLGGNQRRFVFEKNIRAHCILLSISVPGFSIAVVKDDEVVYAKGFGIKNNKSESVTVNVCREKHDPWHRSIKIHRDTYWLPFGRPFSRLHP